MPQDSAPSSAIVRCKPTAPKTKSKKRKKNKPPTTAYIYTKLANLALGDANFYGVVSKFAPPKPTRGSDVILTVSIVDETRPDPVTAGLVMFIHNTALKVRCRELLLSFHVIF